MVNPKTTELATKQWVLTGVAGIMVFAIAWMISGQLFHGVLGQAHTPVEQIGLLLFIWTFTGVLLLILVAGATEINSRVH